MPVQYFNCMSGHRDREQKGQNRIGGNVELQIGYVAVAGIDCRRDRSVTCHVPVYCIRQERCAIDGIENRQFFCRRAILERASRKRVIDLKAARLVFEGRIEAVPEIDIADAAAQ